MALQGQSKHRLTACRPRSPTQSRVSCRTLEFDWWWLKHISCLSTAELPLLLFLGLAAAAVYFFNLPSICRPSGSGAIHPSRPFRSKRAMQAGRVSPRHFAMAVHRSHRYVAVLRNDEVSAQFPSRRSKIQISNFKNYFRTLVLSAFLRSLSFPTCTPATPQVPTAALLWPCEDRHRRNDYMCAVCVGVVLAIILVWHAWRTRNDPMSTSVSVRPNPPKLINLQL